MFKGEESLNPVDPKIESSVVSNLETYQSLGYVSAIRVLSEQEAGNFVRDQLLPAVGGVENLLNSNSLIPHKEFPFIEELTKNPIVMTYVRGLVGDDAYLTGTIFFNKPAGHDAVVSIHQDLGGKGKEDHNLAVWVALSTSNRENGCLQVVPNSHHLGKLPHHRLGPCKGNMLGQSLTLEDGHVDKRDLVPVELRPGEMSMHHGLTVHYSGPNMSDLPRIGVVLRYRSRKNAERQKNFAMFRKFRNIFTR